MKLICAFGFAFADCWFSHEVAQLLVCFSMVYAMQFVLFQVHDIESPKYGKLKRFQGLSMPRDIQVH